MIVTWLICAAAAGLFGRGLYHSGILAGWIAQGLTQIEPAPSEAVAELPDLWAEMDRKMTAIETQMFLAVPSAWWLDPNRWGDKPDWRDDLPRPAVKIAAKITAKKRRPCCPTCGSEQIGVLAEYDGEESLWDCGRCGAEFTKKGETKKSIRRREALKAKAEKESGFYDDLPVQLQRPPGVEPMLHEVMMVQSAPLVVPHNPGSVFDYMGKETESAYPLLPCGCSAFGSITKYGPRKDGTTWVRCGTCEKWWEPASNSADGHRLAQGEIVHRKDDMAPNAVARWEMIRAAQIAGIGGENHGVCPSAICQFPVDKRGGKYYCTNTDCNHHYEGWK